MELMMSGRISLARNKVTPSYDRLQQARKVFVQTHPSDGKNSPTK